MQRMRKLGVGHCCGFTNITNTNEIRRQQFSSKVPGASTWWPWPLTFRVTVSWWSGNN